MKIKDVIKLSATYLGRENVVDYVDNKISNPDENTLKETDILTRCANLVLSELAVSYLPMVKIENVVAVNGRINYSSLSENISSIKNVYLNTGEKAVYTFYPEYIEVGSGTFAVEYEYTPCNLGLNDGTGYLEKQIPVRLIAYGTTAEFCLTEHAFSESVMWHKRFTDGLKVILAPKNKRIMGRRFI